MYDFCVLKTVYMCVIFLYKTGVKLEMGIFGTPGN
jgi:hypothetical protein